MSSQNTVFKHPKLITVTQTLLPNTPFLFRTTVFNVNTNCYLKSHTEQAWNHGP